MYGPLAYTGITLWAYLVVALVAIALGLVLKFSAWLFRDRDTEDRETVSINDLMDDDE